MALPTDNDERKALPVYTFLTEYFFLAFMAVVRVAVAGDKQHKNEGGKIRWAREKSTDQMNTALRHILDYSQGARYDVDNQPHLAKAIWRLSAQLQIDEERARGMHCGCTMNGVPVRRDACEKHQPQLIKPIITTFQRCSAQLSLRETCVLGDNHPGEHRAKRPPSFCTECGVDLEEGVHDVGCLRLNRQPW